MPLDRRDFIKMTLAGVGLTTLGACRSTALRVSGHPRVVVVGGGYAGATAAKYLRDWSGGGVEVVVVEPNPWFTSCPLSNLVLGGSRRLDELQFSYDALKRNHGIQWVRDRVVAVDPTRRSVTLQRGTLQYDRLVLAEGIDFIYDELPMLQSAEAQQAVPHAWKAGPQTLRLQTLLHAMPRGGTFVIAIPRMPFRCPPGPYERVCQVAFYLQRHNPDARIIVLDANPDIVSKKKLFTRVWAEMYPGMVDYRPDSTLTGVDVATRRVRTEFDHVDADVLNVIPPQRAGRVAKALGIANVDRRWCEIDFISYESRLLPGVHVIGDSVAAGLPKSAHMATSQARVCASAIVATLAGEAPDPSPVFSNTCYSFVSDEAAMHVADVYRYDAAKKIMLPAEGGGVSDHPSVLEGSYANDWARNIWSDVLT